ncbi:hypothetical protein FO519_007878 [Halicephalobus sp. NKZ332]|nr:hypothetical protein FO519_007878 [Halicephalobus sp. NKZ332]
MSLTYALRENPNYGLNVTVYPGGNHSIDRVVDQVHVVAGAINDLTKIANNQVNQVGNKVSQTGGNFDMYFKNLSGEAHKISDIATYKFNDFPVSAFYAILILALIVIIVALCYFVSVGGFIAAQRRYQKTENPTQTEDSPVQSSYPDSNV